LTELLKSAHANRGIGVALDAFDGVRLDLACALAIPNDQPNTGSRRIPSVIGGSRLSPRR
jgi:hypothetical protein